MQSNIEYDIIGSQSSKATLTKNYSDNRDSVLAKDFDKMTLDIDYDVHDSEDDRAVEILIEFLDENDNVVSRYAAQNAATDELQIFTNDENGYPIVVPGDRAETAGAEIKAQFSFEFTAHKVRISAREQEGDPGSDPSSNFGAVYIQGTLKTI